MKRKTIEIKEDVKLPGTDIILEKGDKIRVLNESALSWIDLDSIYASYVEALFFTEEDMWQDEDPDLDTSDLKISSELERKIEDDIKDFIREAEKAGIDFNELPSTVGRYNLEDMIGHDFWLTRNRHGAGFWDKDYGGHEDTLTEVAHGFGEVYVWPENGEIVA